MVTAPARPVDETAPRWPIPRAAVPLGVVGVAGFGLLLVLATTMVPVALPAMVAVALLAAPYVVQRPRAVLTTLVVAEITNAATILGGHGVPAMRDALLLFGIAGVVLASRRGTVRFTWSPLYAAMAVFLGVRAVSVLFAVSPGQSFAHALDLARALVFLLLVVTLASHPGGARRLAGVAVGTAAALAFLAVAQELVIGNGSDILGLARVPLAGDRGFTAARHSGPLPDANFWGRSLVLLVPIALSLWLGGTRWRPRALATIAVPLLAAGVYLTGSRGALICLAIGGVAWLALASPRTRRLLLLAPTFVVLFALLPGVGSRLETLGDLDDAAAESGDPSLVGRVAAQRQGLEMFLDNPATGVGARNFRVAEGEYVRRSGLTFSYDLAAHNLYLEMAAESGIAGLGAWLLLYAVALWLPMRALLLRRHVVPLDPLLETLLPVGVLVGLVAWAVASIFLHLAAVQTLLLVAGLGAALDNRARRLAGSARPVPVVSHRRRWRATGVALVAYVLAVVAVAAVTGVARTSWEARREAVVTAPAGASPYDLDIATRVFVRATLASLLERVTATGVVPRDALDVRAAGTSSMVVFVAQGAGADEAAARADLVVEAAVDDVRRLAPNLELQPVPVRVEPVRRTSIDGTKLLATGFFALALQWMVLAWNAARRSLRRRVAFAPA